MVYANPAAGKRRDDYTEVVIADLAGGATLAAVVTKVNEILAELRKAGVIAE